MEMDGFGLVSGREASKMDLENTKMEAEI